MIRSWFDMSLRKVGSGSNTWFYDDCCEFCVKVEKKNLWGFVHDVHFSTRVIHVHMRYTCMVRYYLHTQQTQPLFHQENISIYLSLAYSSIGWEKFWWNLHDIPMNIRFWYTITWCSPENHFIKTCDKWLGKIWFL